MKTIDWKKYIDHISVSQIRTHDRNPRLWALEKLLKMPRTSSKAAEFGKRVHASLECYLSGQPIAYKGELEAKCLEHFGKYWAGDLPDTIGVEVEFKEELWAGLPPVLGYIDWVASDKDSELVVTDHKTSRTRRYFLKEEELAEDIQMMVYAKVMLNKYEILEGVWVQQCQFAYANKKEVLKVVKAWVTREQVDAFVEGLREKVETGILETLRLYELGGLGLVPASCERCNNAFGPNSCPFSGVCRGTETKEACRERLGGGGEVVTDERVTAPPEKDIPINKDVEECNMTCKECKDTQNQIDLGVVMARARDKFKSITNVWDRRDSITQAIVEHVAKHGPDFVVLPSHMREKLSPDYEPVVTRLKEAGVKIYLEI